MICSKTNYTKRWFASIFCLLYVVLGLNAQTYYYKMSSCTQAGRTITDVTGGQFITFQGIKCMETDINGKPCGNGTLQRTAQNKNIYVGSSFWGPNTKFVFSSDRLSLDVITPDGMSYAYQRTKAPVGITTSSLIKGKTSSYTGVVHTNMTGSGNSNGSGTTSTQNTYKKTEHAKKCTKCLGSGACSMCNGKGTHNTIHSGYTKCPSCNGNGRCTMCKGTGTYGSVWY